MQDSIYFGFLITNSIYLPDPLMLSSIAQQGEAEAQAFSLLWRAECSTQAA